MESFALQQGLWELQHVEELLVEPLVISQDEPPVLEALQGVLVGLEVEPHQLWVPDLSEPAVLTTSLFLAAVPAVVFVGWLRW